MLEAAWSWTFTAGYSSPCCCNTVHYRIAGWYVGYTGVCSLHIMCVGSNLHIHVRYSRYTKHIREQHSVEDTYW